MSGLEPVAGVGHGPVSRWRAGLGHTEFFPGVGHARDLRRGQVGLERKAVVVAAAQCLDGVFGLDLHQVVLGVGDVNDVVIEHHVVEVVIAALRPEVFVQ